MSRSEPTNGFPRRYTVVFVVVALALIVGGSALWLPHRGGASTADSDLGLTLLGGGLALVAGFVVARAVFVTQGGIDRELRRAEERRERDNLRLRISMTEQLGGADLRDADLGDVILRQKNLTGADLRRANLEGVTIDRASLDYACLGGANLRRAVIGVPGVASIPMTFADLSAADLTDARVCADLRRGTLRRADLRGADLSSAVLRHPLPEVAEMERERDEREREATILAGAVYDQRTRWPEGFDPVAAGAVLSPPE